MYPRASSRNAFKGLPRLVHSAVVGVYNAEEAQNMNRFLFHLRDHSAFHNGVTLNSIPQILMTETLAKTQTMFGHSSSTFTHCSNEEETKLLARQTATIPRSAHGAVNGMPCNG